MSDLSNWEPHHNSHAILLASITIQFGQAVTGIPWNRILRDGRAAAGTPVTREALAHQLPTPTIIQ